MVLSKLEAHFRQFQAVKTEPLELIFWSDDEAAHCGSTRVTVSCTKPLAGITTMLFLVDLTSRMLVDIQPWTWHRSGVLVRRGTALSWFLLKGLDVGTSIVTSHHVPLQHSAVREKKDNRFDTLSKQKRPSSGSFHTSVLTVCLEWSKGWGASGEGWGMRHKVCKVYYKM